MSNSKLSLIGSGGHAGVLIDMMKLLRVDIDNLYDDNYSNRAFKNIEVVSPIDFNIPENAIIAVGDNLVRRNISIKSKNKIWWKLVHPSAIISRDVNVGQGTVIMAGSLIQTGVNIGEHSIINTGACIDHDCEIGSYSHISPNVSIAGGVCIGEGTHIGIGACVIPGITIGKWVTIGAGAVVIYPVPDYAVVVGNPGRVIKFNSYE
jgi:sugar O-acyltransferase (sialic acid O-acetyltransferase NeuD family)